MQPVPQSPTAPLRLRGASHTYRDGTVALLPIDLRVDAGEFVTLVGPSGCGKSTLLRMVAGLLEPTTGSVSLWGGSSTVLQAGGRRLAFVFQEPTLMPWAPVRANVRLPLDLAGCRRDEAERRVRAALATVGLARFAGHRPRELSGGMMMRASIARALVTEPDLLLMDEPFGALDEITRNRLDDELLALCRQRGLTVVFVTHSIHEAVFLSSRVLVLGPRPGRVVDEVRVDEPHPRTSSFRVTERFARLAHRVHDALQAASDAEGGDGGGDAR